MPRTLDLTYLGELEEEFPFLREWVPPILYDPSRPRAVTFVIEREFDAYGTLWFQRGCPFNVEEEDHRHFSHDGLGGLWIVRESGAFARLRKDVRMMAELDPEQVATDSLARASYDLQRFVPRNAQFVLTAIEYVSIYPYPFPCDPTDKSTWVAHRTPCRMHRVMHYRPGKVSYTLYKGVAPRH